MDSRTKLGYGGLGASAAGLALGLVGVLLAEGRNPLPPLLLVGAAFYLLGGFATVFFLGYRAGTRPYLIQRLLRLAFAAIVIFSLFRAGAPG